MQVPTNLIHQCSFGPISRSESRWSVSSRNVCITFATMFPPKGKIWDWMKVVNQWPIKGQFVWSSLSGSTLSSLQSQTNLSCPAWQGAEARMSKGISVKVAAFKLREPWNLLRFQKPKRILVNITNTILLTTISCSTSIQSWADTRNLM